MDYDAELNKLEIVDYSDDENLVIIKFNNRNYKVRYRIVEDPFFGDWDVKITSCAKTLLDGVGRKIVADKVFLFLA